jgi:hypothetical protein
MIEYWVKAWLILAVVFTVLYLIAMLVAGHGIPGPGKPQSLIPALIAGPVAAAVATALALVVYWLVVIEAH